MTGGNTLEELENIYEVDPGTFRATVERDASVILEELDAGTFDNSQAIVGLEWEFYGVMTGSANLRRVPRRVLELIGFEKELGLHNAEISTRPHPLSAYGLRAQREELRALVHAAQQATRIDQIRLVSDGVWTVPPAGETADRYLGDAITRTVPRPNGSTRDVTFATNKSDDARYHALSNPNGDVRSGGRIDVPNATFEAETVLPGALTTSIQPHYQVPYAVDLPEHFNYALRVAGPLLALGVNSPFLPPDLYDDVPAERILEDGWAEHRIPVFEGALNDPERERGKVRFPRDLETVEQAVHRIAADDLLVALPVERGTRFDDRFAAFDVKRGTYWRWVRPVFDGATRSSANARIEFRPLPGQPTIQDVVAFQAAFAGLMEGLPRFEHPVSALPWSEVRDNFYAAMRSGLQADITWIDANGERTTSLWACLSELLETSREGLVLAGVDAEDAAATLAPLEARLEAWTTPADWRRSRVRRAIEEGATFERAIEEMQAAYVERQVETLLHGTFATWPGVEDSGEAPPSSGLD